jgi:queuosine precursor transporter
VTVFQWIKRITGEKKLWLRATGSTLVSQFIDSFVVLFIAFYISGVMPLKLVIGIGIVNYIYKFIVAIILTPLLYVIHNWIDKFLGHDVAAQMLEQAKKEA